MNDIQILPPEILPNERDSELRWASLYRLEYDAPDGGVNVCYAMDVFPRKNRRKIDVLFYDYIVNNASIPAILEVHKDDDNVPVFYGYLQENREYSAVDTSEESAIKTLGEQARLYYKINKKTRWIRRK